MKRIPIYLPEEDYKEIRLLAFQHEVSMAEEIRKAVSMYLKWSSDPKLAEYYLRKENEN